VSKLVERCPLCGHAESGLFDHREFRGYLVTNRLCKYCGLVYQSPRMSQAELDRFYAEEYRALYQGGGEPTPKDLNTQTGRAISLLAFASKNLERVDRHLDAGSSAGMLLLRFKEAFGSHSIGIEPDPAYRQYAQSKGLDIYSSLDELGKDGSAKFDLISMAHVLEHLPDPVGYLKNLAGNHLIEGGHLLVEVPNLYSHDSFEVAHLFAFSPQTLRQTVEQAGLTIVDMIEHGAPRSRILPLYLTLLARKEPGTQIPEVRPESNVSFRRNLGMLRRRLLSRLFPKLAWVPQT
jgi:SAM-dependent methyltransferase